MTKNQPSSVKEIANILLNIENQKELFQYKPKGFDLWERIRYDVFTQTVIQNNIFNAPHVGTDTGFWFALTFFLKSIFYFFAKNPFLTSPKKYFFSSHPRKQFIDNQWIDIYTNYVIDFLPEKDFYLLERTFNGVHKKSNFKNAKHIDFVEFFVKYSFPFIHRFINITKSKSYIALKSHITESLGNVDYLDRIVKKKYYYSIIYSRFYNALLKLIRPDFVILVGWYSSFDLLNAAKKNNIKTIELQHGTLSAVHMGYNFNSAMQLSNAPDYFLSFGDYWNQFAKHVLPQNRHSIGFPRFNVIKKNLVNLTTVKRSKQILFISQGTIGESLFQHAIQLSNLPIEYDIIFKPHPGEDIEGYKYIINSNKHKINLIQGKIDIYKLIVESEIVVGVYSTAIYEALGLKKTVLLIDLPGIENMEDLIKMNYVTVCKNGIEIFEILNDHRNTEIASKHDELFFVSDSKESFLSFIKKLENNVCQI